VIQDLVNLIHRYLEPLRSRTFLSQDEMEQLLGSVYRIFQFHRLFLQSLENIIERTVMAFGPTDDILRVPPHICTSANYSVIFCSLNGFKRSLYSSDFTFPKHY